jgi:hypothetical protein
MQLDPNNPKLSFRTPAACPALHPFLHNDISKLILKFDVERMKLDMEGAFAKFGSANKTRFQTYRGLGLQAAEGFDDYFDTMQDLQDLRAIRPVADSDFRHLNDIGQLFKYIFERFADLGINLVRARLLTAYPGHQHEPHYDYDFRIHIPITTNSRCEAIFGNNIYHMAADGSSYLHNGYHRHTFRNLGESERVHFIAGVAGLSGLHRALTGR